MATVSGGLTGGSLVNAQIAGVAGQNAVENNELVQRTPESVIQNIEKKKEKIKSEVCTSGMSQAACNKAIAAEFDRNNAEFGKMLIDLATLVPGISEADALSILLNEKTLSGDETSRIWGAIGIITAGYGQKLRLAGKGLRALNPAEELVTSTGHVIKNVEANAIKSESRGVGKEAGKDAAKAGKGANGQIIKNSDGLNEVKINQTPLEGQNRLNTIDAMGNGKLNPAEAAAAARIENILGKMERLPDTNAVGKNADYIITNGPNKGKTVDLMYTTKNLSQKEIDGINKFFEKNMTVPKVSGKLPDGKQQILDHLNKADIVPVDFNVLTPKNQRIFTDYVKSLPKSQQDKIIIMR